MIQLIIKLHSATWSGFLLVLGKKFFLRFWIYLEIERVRIFGCWFFGWEPFCRRESQNFEDFLKFLLFSCSLSCCSHWSCAHWVSRYVLYGLTFYHILLITCLDLPFQTPRNQLCVALTPFHLLCFLRAFLSPSVLILQRSHSQSLCGLTRNTWRKGILVPIFLFSFFVLKTQWTGILFMPILMYICSFIYFFSLPPHFRQFYSSLASCFVQTHYSANQALPFKLCVPWGVKNQPIHLFSHLKAFFLTPSVVPFRKKWAELFLVQYHLGESHN